MSEVVTGATGGAGIPFMDIFAKLGSTGGGGGIPAKTAGSGTAIFSRGIVKSGGGALEEDVVPHSGVSWPSSANDVAGGT